MKKREKRERNKINLQCIQISIQKPSKSMCRHQGYEGQAWPQEKWNEPSEKDKKKKNY